MLSYEESQGQRHLIGTKILEGTHCVLHPNRSAMFIVNINEPSDETFPWSYDGEGGSGFLDLKEVFNGESIANGYGFRYQGSKPGSLVVFDEMLVFTRKESRAALTLQQIHLMNLLKKGERVPPLPPIAIFLYLTKSYLNVYAGFSNALNHTTSPSLEMKERTIEVQGQLQIQAARQLEFYKGMNGSGPNINVLGNALAIAQHHDVVSGTQRQHVAANYASRIAKGYAEDYIQVKGTNISTYGGTPVVHALQPVETINYVSVHDNETSLILLDLRNTGQFLEERFGDGKSAFQLKKTSQLKY